MFILLILARIAFLAVNSADFIGLEASEIAQAFVRGFRFDLATTLITVTAPIFLLFIPAPIRWRRIASRLSFWLFAVILVVAGFILAGDIFFYSESSHHLTLEPVDLLSDFSPFIQTLIDGYLLAALIAVMIIIGAIWAVIHIYRRYDYFNQQISGWSLQRTVVLVPVLLFTFIGARGGIQKEPLKSADAIVGKSTVLGNIVLNGWYSFLSESIKSKRPDHFMDDSVAIAEIRKMVDPFAEFSTDRYPLFRRMSSKSTIGTPEERLNVVIIIVESLNAEYLQAFGGRKAIMPFLDSLAQQSLIFTNFHALSTRSFRGVTAILASYPNLSVDSYRLTFQLPKLRGLGAILTENGYAVRFMHAAPENSMGITAVSAMSGYSDFISQEDFPDGQDNGSWGIWDHIALERMTGDMDKMNEPFHYGIFTLCTHSPWTLPENFSHPFPLEDENSEIYNTFAYLDGALEQFFFRESQRERFSRTLYVIVGDHTTHASEVERFRIGSIFYAPGRLGPRVDNRLADQMDILPTVLDLCGIEDECSPFGSSLMDSLSGFPWSVHYQSNQLNYQQDSLMLVTTLTHNFGLYVVRQPDITGGGLLNTERSAAEIMTFRVKAIYQIAEMLVNQNRIAP